MYCINWKVKLSAFIMFFSLTSCSSINYMKTYSGEPLPKNNVSFFVRENYGVRIYCIDGRKIPGECLTSPSEFLKYFEFLPGKHEIKFRYTTISSRGESTFSTGGLFTVHYDALPEHTYAITPNINYEDSTWNPSVIDITDELRTTKRSLSESIDEAFKSYRQHPVQPISIGNNTVLINSYHLEVSIDEEETYHSLLTLYFKLLPGKHILKVRSNLRKNVPADILTFTGESKHIYELIPDEGSAWNPKIIDVTNEMDDVKENMVDSINKFIRE